MKKITAIITGLATTLLTLSVTALTAATAFADQPPGDPLLPMSLSDYQKNQNLSGGKLDALTNYFMLQDLTYQEIILAVVKTILFLAGSLVVIGLLVVGAMYLVGSASEESIGNAKKVLGYLGIGLIVITISYALVTGVLQINLFN